MIARCVEMDLWEPKNREQKALELWDVFLGRRNKSLLQIIFFSQLLGRLSGCCLWDLCSVKADISGKWVWSCFKNFWWNSFRKHACSLKLKVFMLKYLRFERLLLNLRKCSCYYSDGIVSQGEICIGTDLWLSGR